MITGSHVIVYSKDEEADRNFFKEVFGFDSVDAGHGWLIFALPPAEIAFHPGDESRHELYLMCDDLEKTMRSGFQRADRRPTLGPPRSPRPARRRKPGHLSTETPGPAPAPDYKRLTAPQSPSDNATSS